jgi:radical SAM superfamily enzyme YgiQ (UPF0313 family)
MGSVLLSIVQFLKCDGEGGRRRMSSRVLLISNNCCDQPYPVFPLGLAHLDTALRRAGHATRLLDCQVPDEPIEDILVEFRPDVVGVSLRNVDDVQLVSRQTYFGDAVNVCQAVRQVWNRPIVLGGSAFSIFPDRLLALTGADYGIHGPGEVAFKRLIAALAAGADPAGIPGLVYRRGEQIVINPRDTNGSTFLDPAERPPHLVEYYLRHSSMLNISTQRGCGLPCCFCTYPLIEGRENHRRPPEAVAEELAAIQRQGAKHVFIVDAVFNLTNDHVSDICDAILRRRVNLTWSCFLRPKNLTAGLMTLMARAGLTHIEFGTDSFCDEVLAEYGKTFTFADILHSSELARAARVHYSHFVICGGPGETTEKLRTGFANSQRLTGTVIFAFAGMRVYPGTALFVRAQREGMLSADTDLLDPVYYISPSLREEELLQQLAEFGERAPNWITGPLPANFSRIAERLRQRGIVGPLWEYFGTLWRMR